MSKEIINGISMFNPNIHIDISHYKTTTANDEPAIYIVEMPTGVAHHLGNKLMVFTRLISEKEHQAREQAYKLDSDEYFKDHIKSLG
jgi:hypothetical protein